MAIFFQLLYITGHLQHILAKKQIKSIGFKEKKNNWLTHIYFAVKIFQVLMVASFINFVSI